MIVSTVDRRIWRPEGGLAKKEEFESFTSISKYLACPIIYHKYYTSHYREPVVPASLLGRATHETIASVLVEKLLRGINLPLEAIDETFHIKWGVELFLAKNQPGGISWSGLPSPQELEETGRQLLRHWGRDILPEVEPKAVEEPFSARLKGIKQFLYGRWDLVTPGGFVDHKTANREYSPIKEKSFALQMAIYYIGHLDKYKTWPQEVTLTWLMTTGELEVSVVPFSLDKSVVQQILDNEIKPAMLGIAKSKETGVWPDTCGKHKDVIDARPIDSKPVAGS